MSAELVPYNLNEKNVVIYRTEDNTLQLDVQLAAETVWLNRHQMALLFDRDVKTIGKHIANALKEELCPTTVKNPTLNDDKQVVAKFATTASDGKIYQVEHYRWLVIDDQLYHCGHSIKDMGKKLSAITFMETPADTVLRQII